MRGSSKPGIVLFSTGLAVFAVFLDTSILYVAFPAMSASFADADPAAMSWVLNAYTIVFAAMLIPAGRLADRIGRRQTFLGAVVIFTIASMLCGLAPDVWFLVAARVLQAVGAAAMVPASLALILQTYPREQIPHAISIWGAIGAVAGAAGPTLGAVLIEALDWRWVFFINLPVGIISLIVGLRVLPEGREAVRGRIPDILSAVLVIVALALVSYGIVETERYGLGDWRLWAAIAAGLIVLGLFVVRSGRISNPVLDLALFKHRGFSLANGAMLLYSIAFVGAFLGSILFMTELWGYSIIQAGFGIGIGPAIVSLLAPRFGLLSTRIGQRALLIPGGLMWAVGAGYLLLVATEEPAYFTVFLPAYVLLSVGVAMILGQLNSTAMQDLPPDQFGQGSATSQANRNLGTTIGVAMTIALITASPGLAGFQYTWLMVMGGGLAVTLISWLLPRHVPQPVS